MIKYLRQEAQEVRNEHRRKYLNKVRTLEKRYKEEEEEKLRPPPGM